MSEAGAADYAGQIREYLTYCEAAREQLEARGGRVDPRYHPSADGAVKMIPHGSDRARAAAIRRAFSDLTSEVTGPGILRLGDSLGREARRPEAEAEPEAG
jgi:hypothetical protein